MLKRRLFALAILAVVSVAGCGPNVTETAPVQRIVTPPVPRTGVVAPYRIGVGDEVELKFFFTPELNDRLTVRPDGKISIMFAQDMQAAGLTADQLAASIKDKLASHIKQLDLVVIVRTFVSQKVYVGGEVAKPGPIQIIAREDLLQVLNDAGWITPVASREKMMLVRRGANGKDQIYVIDFKKIMSGEDMSQNVTLAPGDIVLVPPTGMVDADRWVDQNIRQILPVNTGAFFNVGR